ncbi:MAG: hypothetical protein LUG13_01515 [Oscillospiraceae bacterium]|nr:hypothetical protein [Oscillospiraceae bacterium]
MRQFELADGRGRLTLCEEGNRVVATARMEDDGRGIYKVYLLGNGSRMLLGTLAPEQGALTLRRTVSLRALEEQRLWPPSGAEAELSFSFSGGTREAVPLRGWRREDCPARLMGDRLLAESAKCLGGMLCRREDGFCLAFPYREDCAFPLVPLFCFARVAKLDGRRFFLFDFNENGCPIFRINDAEKKHTSK